MYMSILFKTAYIAKMTFPSKNASEKNHTVMLSNIKHFIFDHLHFLKILKGRFNNLIY